MLLICTEWKTKEPTAFLPSLATPGRRLALVCAVLQIFSRVCPVWGVPGLCKKTTASSFGIFPQGIWGHREILCKFCCSLTIWGWGCAVGASLPGLPQWPWLPPCAGSNVSLPRPETLLTFPAAFFREGNVSVLRNALNFPSNVFERGEQRHYYTVL